MAIIIQHYTKAAKDFYVAINAETGKAAIKDRLPSLAQFLLGLGNIASIQYREGFYC